MFTTNEIQCAVMSLANGKASGPDGLPNEFAKLYWDMLKNDFIDIFSDLYSCTLNLEPYNKANIILLPKKEEAVSPADYRPISIIAYIPKLISKVLTTRLQLHIDRLVSPVQTGFIKNRHIAENFISAREILHHLRMEKEPAILLKLDFSKAFDSVSWEFLLSLLDKRGFPPKFITWISMLLSTASSSLLINGVNGASFPHKKGLRQGDPLSPYLFILVADVLAKMCDAVAMSVNDNDNLSRKFRAPFKILQYADDTMIFAAVKGQVIQKLSLLLQLFSQVTGLAINSTKSVFIPLNLNAAHISMVQNILGFNASALPITYLGMPLNANAPDKASFAPLLQKIKKRLDGWRAKMLSRAGKLQLCKSVISAIPIYHMSCFLLPAWLINDIDKLRRNFSWSSGTDMHRGVSLISWTLACLPKSYGGLGVIDLKLQNKALLTRWWWRLCTKDKSIWRDTAVCIFPNSSNINRPLHWRKKGSFFWTALNSVKSLFQLSTSWRVGDGNRISFWLDNWGAGNLSLLYSKPHANSYKLLHCSLSDAAHGPHTVFQLPPTENFNNILEQINLLHLTNNEDVIRWKWTKSNQFSAASLYKRLVTAGKMKSNLTKPWKFKLKPSIQLFCYFFQRDRLLTKQRLQQWNIQVTTGCSLCTSNAVESSMHLFFLCPFSGVVWQKIQQHFGFNLNLSGDNCALMFEQLIDSATATMCLKRAQTTITATLWCIWKERNLRLFNNKARRIETLVQEILICACQNYTYC